MSDSNGAGSKVSFFIVGMGIGALVGLLFAPKSGEETREYLAGKGRRQPRICAEESAANSANAPKICSNAARKSWRRQKDAVTTAVEAGKDTYRRESKVS